MALDVDVDVANENLFGIFFRLLIFPRMSIFRFKIKRIIPFSICQILYELVLNSVPSSVSNGIRETSLHVWLLSFFANVVLSFNIF